jgi:hypothetical protein
MAGQCCPPLEMGKMSNPNVDFWTWYDRVQQTAPLTAVGKIMTAAGYHVAHTGGGCLTWEQTLEDGYRWICDDGNGLGETVAETYLVGTYNKDAELIAEGAAPDLHAALAWMEKSDDDKLNEAARWDAKA